MTRRQLGFSEIQAELTNLSILSNLPNLLIYPNFVKILKKTLNVLKFNFQSGFYFGIFYLRVKYLLGSV